MQVNWRDGNQLDSIGFCDSRDPFEAWHGSLCDMCCLSVCSVNITSIQWLDGSSAGLYVTGKRVLGVFWTANRQLRAVVACRTPSQCHHVSKRQRNWTVQLCWVRVGRPAFGFIAATRRQTTAAKNSSCNALVNHPWFVYIRDIPAISGDLYGVLEDTTRHH